MAHRKLQSAAKGILTLRLGVIDATSGFIQVPVDSEASKLLTIVTHSGCFSPKVCNSSALWNILTDGNSRLDSKLAILKNMDNFLLYGTTLEDLEMFKEFAKKKNLKLPRNFSSLRRLSSVGAR